MNEHQSPHHDEPPPVAAPIRERPEPAVERPKPVEAPGAPDAVRAAQVAREEKAHALVRGRGVEWVRPTELMARHSATVAGRGIDFQAELSRRTRRPLAAGARRVGERIRRLPPVSAFGRSTAPQQVVRPGVGMS